jgi:F0F1-type ATP synthase assembly protein I
VKKQNPKPTPNSKLPDNAGDVAKYSGLGLQMLAMIGLGVWGGISIDRYWSTTPVWSAVLAIFSVIASLVYVIRSISYD